MTRKILMLMLMAILALGLAACGSDDGEETPEPTAAPTAVEDSANVQTAEEPAPALTKMVPTKALVPTEKPAVTAEADEVLELTDRTSGLEGLESYRLTWTSEWTPDDPTKEPMRMTWTQEYTSDPLAQSIAWSGSSEATGGEETISRMWRVGTTAYMMFDNGGETQCMAITQDEEDTEPPFDPSLLGSVENATYVGRETVNGLPTKHYRYDTTGFTLFGADNVNGDLWVAEDGGYMVKEALSWDGGAGPFSVLEQDEAKGTGSWTWELSDINAEFIIQPPEECLNPAGDAALPVPPGAKSTMQTAQMMQYTLTTPVAEIVEFYKEAMPAAGWELSGDPTDMGGMAILAFTKDDQSANIMITGDDSGGSMVIVTME